MKLADLAPDLVRVLNSRAIHTPPRFAASDIRRETVMVTMRDGVRLATDLHLPPDLPAPAIAVRTPYGRGSDALACVFLAFAQRGYVVIAQDCRGTGDSEPDSWDYYMFEPEDGHDLVDWVSEQSWFDGFLGACGGSYLGQTQWPMAQHPKMSAIAPEVSGLGVAVNQAHLHMFLNAFARSVGKGEDKVPVALEDLERQMVSETLSTGYFNEPLHRPFSAVLLARFPELTTMPPSAAKRWLWERYCALSCADRAELVRQATGAAHVSMVELELLSEIFGQRISHDSHTLPHPDPAELVRSFHAPALMITGWYDWSLNDALATWTLLAPVSSRSRLVIAPNAHNAPGYHEAMAEHPELHHTHRTADNVELLLRWYAAVRQGKTDSWPRVIYYLMGANDWRAADAWPPPEAAEMRLYLAPGGVLNDRFPGGPADPDRYRYDPASPTPTVGGSILSYVYPPGSIDVAQVQQRPDVRVYTTPPLERDLDVAGPLRLVLHASSSAVDTDFVARLSDVFPDGRAIQLQSGLVRARYRNGDGDPELLTPGRVYRFDIDMWATANRFKAGHRLRLDIASADFPRFDRNANRGGQSGSPIIAQQTVHHDAARPSHLILSVIAGETDNAQAFAHLPQNA